MARSAGKRASAAGLCAVIYALSLYCAASAYADNGRDVAQAIVDPDGTIRAPSYTLPPSFYQSEESKERRKAIIEDRRRGAPVDLVAEARSIHPVHIETKIVAGVKTFTFSPLQGVDEGKRQQVLINLHGGGFNGGSPDFIFLESIPIAATAGVKVIGIDYRLAPKHRFPAASEDVAAVYRELLKTYAPSNIGIYGCSAGGILTAESIAWFLKEGLPLPGAIGIFCAADATIKGDSRFMSPEMSTMPAKHAAELDSGLRYFKGADMGDPLVSPVFHSDILSRFPPTLFVTGSRDFTASSIFFAHSQMVRLGKEAQLHVWEGVGHAFFFDPNLPESREMYAVTAKFFADRLGKSMRVN